MLREEHVDGLWGKKLDFFNNFTKGSLRVLNSRIMQLPEKFFKTIPMSVFHLRSLNQDLWK